MRFPTLAMILLTGSAMGSTIPPTLSQLMQGVSLDLMSRSLFSVNGESISFTTSELEDLSASAVARSQNRRARCKCRLITSECVMLSSVDALPHTPRRDVGVEPLAETLLPRPGTTRLIQHFRKH